MVKVNATRPSVTLESGEEIVADFIVGADSVHGIARSVVSGGSPDTSGDRYLTISCTLPCDEFSADPDLKSLLNESSVCHLDLYRSLETADYIFYLLVVYMGGGGYANAGADECQF